MKGVFNALLQVLQAFLPFGISLGHAFALKVFQDMANDLFQCVLSLHWGRSMGIVDGFLKGRTLSVLPSRINFSYRPDRVQG